MKLPNITPAENSPQRNNSPKTKSNQKETKTKPKPKKHPKVKQSINPPYHPQAPPPHALEDPTPDPPTPPTDRAYTSHPAPVCLQTHPGPLADLRTLRTKHSARLPAPSECAGQVVGEVRVACRGRLLSLERSGGKSFARLLGRDCCVASRGGFGGSRLASCGGGVRCVLGR